MKKVIFLGTPDFSIPTLDNLYKDNEIDLMFVLTKQDKKSNRGMQISFSPVKKFCIEHNIKYYQPNKLKDDREIISLIKDSKPDFLVVVAYGEILSKEILDIPIACINGHASLLPKYRGSSPIQSCILNGDRITGTTTMLMEEKLDSGDILLKKELNLLGDENCEFLFNKLSIMTADLVIETLKNFENIKKTPQNENEATYVKLVKKEDGFVDLKKESIDNLCRKVRAYNPWPSVYTSFNDRFLKLFEVERVNNIISSDTIWINDVFFIANSELYAKLVDGTVKVTKLQIEGKKKMSSKDFINGYKNR